MSANYKSVKKYTPLYLTIFTGIFITAAIMNWNSEAQRKEQEARFQQQIDRATVNLQRNFDSYTDKLFSIKDYFVSESFKVEYSQFKVFTNRIIDSNSGIRALEWVPEVTQENRQVFELALKNQGFKEFQISETRDGKLVRASDRPFYYPIRYVNPLAINQEALGFDLGSEMVRNDALVRAKSTSRISTTRKVILVQELGEKFGILTFLPIYSEIASSPKLRGFVVGVFRVEDIAKQAYDSYDYKFNVHFYDDTYQNEQSFLGVYEFQNKDFLSPTANKLAATKIISNSPFCQNINLCTRKITIGDRQWSVAYVPSPDHWQYQTFRSFEFLFIGVLLTAGASSYLITIIRSTEKLKSAKTEITRLNQELQSENIQMVAELNILQKMQEMILPKGEEMKIAGLDICGFSQPAQKIGGDYYDVLVNGDVVTITMGDVTGHGLESGIVMLMAQTAVRTLKESGEDDPVRLLDILNKTIYGNVRRINPSKNLSLVILDYKDGNIRISGQHEEVLLMRNNGVLERIDTQDLGFPIGLDMHIADFVSYQMAELHPNDVLILYTDGITEAENAQHEFYGMERFCEQIRRHFNHSALEIQQAVIADLYEFIGNQALLDDVTLLVVKRTTK